MNSGIVYLLFMCIVILEFTALYSVKKYSLHGSGYLLAICILCYALIPLFLFLILKQKQNIATVNIIWNVLSSVYGVLIGVVLFKERINLIQSLGIVLGVVGLVLIFSSN